MRAKQSVIASGIESIFGTSTPYLASRIAVSRPGARTRPRAGAATLEDEDGKAAFKSHRTQPFPETSMGEGLLHDARNLVGTIGLYCDLLSMPGVLKPEHRQYPVELRLLGARSKSLIDRLMQSVFALEGAAGVSVGRRGADNVNLCAGEDVSSRGAGNPVKKVSLRSVVERCSGLLSRVANGRPIEITYGPAAAVPVKVPEEAIERILVNLVRNAAGALGPQMFGSERLAEENLKSVPNAVCILVGPMLSRVGEHKPWPFQRVRLVVEDAGSGMNPRQLERLLSGNGARSRGGHGIGFCVVRDLVAASEGEIRVMSEPGIGTRVQIDWPIAAIPEEEGMMDTRNLQLGPLPAIRFPAAVNYGSMLSLMGDITLDVRLELAQ